MANDTWGRRFAHSDKMLGRRAVRAHHCWSFVIGHLSFEACLVKVVTAAEMREIDRRCTAEYGIPSLLLMELAGLGTVRGPEDRSALAEGVDQADVLVDALLGTGAVGAPQGLLAEAVDLLNGAEVPVVSVDVPSGLWADAPDP